MLNFPGFKHVQECRPPILAASMRGQGLVLASTLSASPQKAAGHVDSLALQDPEAHWGRLIELGVNMIQTDSPASLIAFLDSRGIRQKSAGR